MGIRRRDVASATAIAAAATVAAVAVPARAHSKDESTWDLIKRTGQVRMGIFEYSPYFMRDKASGEWVGAMVEMAKDIAKELDVKLGDTIVWNVQGVEIPTRITSLRKVV